jgi:two-component system response regulator FixJ
MTPKAAIHIVDDDPAIRDSLATLLESLDYRVFSHDGAGAFLGANPQEADCLIIDVRMPGMDGLELQAELTRRGLRIPVIVMTGHAEVPLAVRAMKAGAVDFVEKPFDQAILVGAMERAIEIGRQVGQNQKLDAAVTARLAQLTPREREVLEALVAGKPNKIIAFDLNISPRTVEIHRARVMEKMAARTLSDLVRMALSAGISP